MRLVERLVSVTDDPLWSRRRLYRIADNFLAFHLGVVARYRAETDGGLGPSILPVLERGLDRHPGGRWEQAFRDHLRRVVACGELAADVVALGPWWRADGQDEIDALAGEARVPVLVGEAKWTRAVDGSRLLRILRYKAAAVTDDVERMVYVVGARKHVVNLPPGVVGIIAEEVFAA